MPKNKKQGLLFVISAPSGCGKTTLCEKLLHKTPALLRSISFTTRGPRKTEQNGIDYHFVSEKTFDLFVKNGKFLEHARVFGKSYGTPIAPIKKALKSGKDVLLSIDVKGAMQVKKLFPEQSVAIFILPPSLSALQNRLIKRHADTKGEIKKRLSMAKQEIAYLHKYDYAIINHKLNSALRQLKAIVTSERIRIKR